MWSIKFIHVSPISSLKISTRNKTRRVKRLFRFEKTESERCLILNNANDLTDLRRNYGALKHTKLASVVNSPKLKFLGLHHSFFIKFPCWNLRTNFTEPFTTQIYKPCRVGDFSDRFSRGAIIVVNHRLKAPRRNRQINPKMFFFSLLLSNLLEVAVKIFILEYFWAWRKIFGGGEREKKLWWRRYDIHPGNEKKN